MRRFPAHGVYAFGVAVLGIVAIGVITALFALTGKIYRSHAGSYAIVVPSAALSGWICGWLCWRGLMSKPPMSKRRALAIALTTIVSTLFVGGIVGWLAFAVPASFEPSELDEQRGALEILLKLILPGLLLGPLYAMVVYGLPFSLLILGWTFWRRRAVNRAAVA